jgi:hypothetical protein
MPITVNKERVFRETTCSYEYVEGGEPKVEQIRVQYYPWTVRELKDYRAEAAKKQKSIKDGDDAAIGWVSEMLARRLHALPDLLDGRGKPVKISVEFLESLTFPQLGAINQAIEDDVAPKSQPPK